MHFIFSDEVVLLFDFWNVHSPAGKHWEAQACSLGSHSSRQWRTWFLFIMPSVDMTEPDSSCINIENFAFLIPLQPVPFSLQKAPLSH